MADKSAIEWTDATWNPLKGTVGRWACSKISPGCDHCYASSMNHRFGGPGYPRVGEPAADTVRLDERVLTQPSRWRRPRTVFVCSMTDLFHEDVPFEWIDRIFAEMVVNPRHVFQVLTKRPRRMLEWLLARAVAGGAGSVERLPAHIWVGVSVELDRYSWRAERLRQIPAAVRFVSAEPLLGPLPSLDLTGIHWLIAGGESGHGARPMHPDWARGLRDRCQKAGVAFFFKQWGEYAPDEAQDPMVWDYGEIPLLPDGMDCRGLEALADRGLGAVLMRRVGKKAGGRLIDGREWNEMPEVRS